MAGRPAQRQNVRMSSPLVRTAALALAAAGCAVDPGPAPPAGAASDPALLLSELAPADSSAAGRSAQPLDLLDAPARCDAVARATHPPVRIARAQFIDDGTAFALDGAGRPVGDALPAHCRVNGRIDAEAGPPTAFELRLPARWNGRFLQQGRDADRLDVPEAIGRGTGAGGLERTALSDGFAVLSSDAGHTDPLVALGPLQARELADRALAGAVRAGQALVAAFYGRPADRSYHSGCGDGGRDGLLFAQRWPEVFDGIVAVAPTLHETTSAAAGVWALQRLAAAGPPARAGRPAEPPTLAVEEMFLLAQAVLAQCDALDGVADGFVMDMAGCRFDAAALACTAGRTDACLSRPRLDALAQAMAGPQDAAGAALYAPWPWDPGLASPGWRAWALGADARRGERAAAVLGRLVAAPPPTKIGVGRFDVARDTPRLQAVREAEAAFASAPLHAFRAREGRLLLVHGAADPVVSPWSTLAFQRLHSAAHAGAETEASDEHVRSFIVPGMNHCSGGPATDRFDALAAVVQWVEHARAPERIEARGSAVLRDETRPLCPWPRVARYGGQGPPGHASSHRCE